MTAGQEGESSRKNRGPGYLGACDTCESAPWDLCFRPKLTPAPGRIRQGPLPGGSFGSLTLFALLSRVKCTRLTPDDPVCVACKRRSINCTHLRFGGARFKPREGKRIAAAIATFGRADPTNSQTTVARGADEPLGLLDTLQLVRRTGSLSETSPEALLGWSEDASAFYASLLDSYIASTHFKSVQLPARR